MKDDEILKKTSRLQDKIKDLEDDRKILLESNERLVNLVEQMYAFLIAEYKQGNLESSKLYQGSNHRADGKIDIDSIQYDINTVKRKVSDLNYRKIKD